MIWMPPLVFDPYCGSKLLSLENKFTPSIKKKKKKKIYESYEQIWKNQKIQFSRKRAQVILMNKIYVIEGTKEVMQKIRESIPLIRRGQKK